MDVRRLLLNVGFWIIYSFTFDAVSGLVFPDISPDTTLFLWFAGLCTGTFLFNAAWYWFTIRRPG
jgi:hypothetical protein